MRLSPGANNRDLRGDLRIDPAINLRPFTGRYGTRARYSLNIRQKAYISKITDGATANLGAKDPSRSYLGAGTGSKVLCLIPATNRTTQLDNGINC